MEIVSEKEDRIVIFEKEDLEDGKPREIIELYNADIAATREDDTTVRVIKNRKTGELGLMPLKFFMEGYNE